MVKKFLLYLRAPFFTAVLVPAGLGAAVAYRFTREFDLPLFLMTCLGLAAANGGVNLLNDYVDFKTGCDVKNRYRSPLAGGSPFLVEGTERPTTFLALSALMFFIALACGVYLAVRVDGGFGPIAVLLLAGGALGILYDTMLAYKGLGEAIVFLLCGPLPVLGSYYVQTGELSWRPIVASIPVALLIAAILWVNEIPDIEADAGANKRTLVVRLGSRSAALILGFLFTSAYLWSIALAIAGYGVAVLLVLLSAPLAYRAALRALEHHDQPPEMLPAQRDTVITHLLVGVLLMVGVLI